MVYPSLEARNYQCLRDVCCGKDVLCCLFNYRDRSEVAEQAASPDLSVILFSHDVCETHLRARVKHRYSLPAVRLS